MDSGQNIMEIQSRSSNLKQWLLYNTYSKNQINENFVKIQIENY